MNLSKTINRSKLLKVTSDMGYSTYLRHEIMLLFKNIPEEMKESIAQKMIPLIRNSKTEQEAIQKARQLVEQTQ